MGEGIRILMGRPFGRGRWVGLKVSRGEYRARYLGFGQDERERERDRSCSLI